MDTEQQPSKHSATSSYDSMSTVIRHAASFSQFVFPLKQTYFQTHRYDPKVLEPEVIEKTGHFNVVQAEDSMELTADYDLSSLNSIIIKPPTCRKKELPENFTPSFDSSESHTDARSLRTIRTVHTSISENAAKYGSIFPSTPPRSHRASRVFTPPPPIPDKLPDIKLSMTSSSEKDSREQPIPPNSLAARELIYHDYYRILFLLWLAGFLFLPIWLVAGCLARFKVRPLIQALEGNGHIFGLTLAAAKEYDQLPLEIRNSMKYKRLVHACVVACEASAILAAILITALPVIVAIIVSTR